MGNLYCKIFGHSKTHWPVGLGGSAVFVWCSTCGKEFENESLEMRNKVHKLEQEVKDLNRVIDYYKTSNANLQKGLDAYMDIVDQICKKQDDKIKEPDNDLICECCNEPFFSDGGTTVICSDCESEQDKFNKCEGRGI